MKIRVGDLIQVMSGKEADKGKQAKILKVIKDENRVLIEGVNIVTKHMKKMGATPGQILKIEKPIHISNVMLVCPFTKKPTRLGTVKVEEKGKVKKFRFSKMAVKELNKDPKDCIIK
ncbi:MAG: 50S ribosomal protein L24 [Candidatus Gracilibacteria bacterium]|nr:50S ribosomal protein L24 [Candidatus Gracilibacteria bacterium]